MLGLVALVLSLALRVLWESGGQLLSFILSHNMIKDMISPNR